MNDQFRTAGHVDTAEDFLGNDFDLALVGKGFFCVQTPDGVHYPRKGDFTLNAEGQGQRYLLGSIDGGSWGFSAVEILQPENVPASPAEPQTEVDRRLSEVGTRFLERYRNEVLSGYETRVAALDRLHDRL